MADFVVTGTGRCGTAHCSFVLKRMGVPAAHEEFFTLDRRSFDDRDRLAYDAYPTNDVALMAAPFLTMLEKPSVHLVRDPVDTVNSFLTAGVTMRSPNVISDFIHHWVKLEGATDAELWADYWIKWNQMCAEAASVTVPIEALSAGGISDAFLSPIIGASGFVANWRALGVTTNRVHGVTSNIVPPQLVDRLRRAGEAYGYAA